MLLTDIDNIKDLQDIDIPKPENLDEMLEIASSTSTVALTK